MSLTEYHLRKLMDDIKNKNSYNENSRQYLRNKFNTNEAYNKFESDLEKYILYGGSEPIIDKKGGGWMDMAKTGATQLLNQGSTYIRKQAEDIKIQGEKVLKEKQEELQQQSQEYLRKMQEDAKKQAEQIIRETQQKIDQSVKQGVDNVNKKISETVSQVSQNRTGGIMKIPIYK